MKTKLISMVLASTLALAGCVNDGSGGMFGGMGTKQGVGTAAGAVLGGLAGSKMGGGSGKLWTTGAGAVLGAFIGSSVGKSLDQADMAYHQQAFERAYTAPINQPINWNNNQSGHSGSVTPVREGRQASTGNLCRQYKQTIVVDGQAETAYGTACQQPDGTWALAN